MKISHPLKGSIIHYYNLKLELYPTRLSGDDINKIVNDICIKYKISEVRLSEIIRS